MLPNMLIPFLLHQLAHLATLLILRHDKQARLSIRIEYLLQFAPKLPQFGVDS